MAPPGNGGEHWECPGVRRLRLAIVGFGRLGSACGAALAAAADLELGGVVRRGSAALPAAFAHATVAGHMRDLEHVDAALLCVPAEHTTGVACELLQGRMPIVECAQLGALARVEHYAAIEGAARHHRVQAMIGCGWDPGALPLLNRLFEVLIPRGSTVLGRHPGKSLHHTAAVEEIPGVKEALTGELRDASGKLRRYVYFQLANGANAEEVRRSIESDPLFAGEETEVFEMADLASLEASSGLVIERRSLATAGEHQSLSLDARFDVWTFAARVMLDAARAVPELPPGAHRYGLRCSDATGASQRT
jgi:diaminopimelate dehydrogenase